MNYLDRIACGESFPYVRVKGAPRKRIRATMLRLAAQAGYSRGDTYMCVACGDYVKGSDIQMGHVVSNHDGADYLPHNLMLMCGECNRELGTQTLTEAMTPRYDTRPLWDGYLDEPPAPKDIRMQWLPVAQG